MSHKLLTEEIPLRPSLRPRDPSQGMVEFYVDPAYTCLEKFVVTPPSGTASARGVLQPSLMQILIRTAKGNGSWVSSSDLIEGLVVSVPDDPMYSINKLLGSIPAQFPGLIDKRYAGEGHVRINPCYKIWWKFPSLFSDVGLARTSNSPPLRFTVKKGGGQGAEVIAYNLDVGAPAFRFRYFGKHWQLIGIQGEFQDALTVGRLLVLLDTIYSVG
jgi:hypothetical protein